ncbi:metal-dependent hydrolase [Silvibacterium sp.]|uniref:metal-dependent hydrolase n=1 Tax=Silvibacterium sp. TaxID=1964179 RepID=UPI0039E6BFB5
MEPVTHFLTGACLARSGFNRKAAYATLAMTLAAEAPDLDVIWGRLGPVAGFEHHRGITHTFLAAPVIALVTVGAMWLIHRFRKKPTVAPIRWGLLWCFALLADLSHILLDFTNNYGVRPLFPFDAHWHAWSIVFIFDPWIFLALLAALVLPWIFGLADSEIGARRQPFRARGWSVTALIFVVLWWSLRNAEQRHAIALVQNTNAIAAPVTRIVGEPYMLDPFRWHVLAETRDYYQTAEVHTLHDVVEERSPDGDDLIYKPPVTPAVAAAKQSWLGRVYLDWSQFPVTTDVANDPIPYDTAPQPQPGWHTVQFEDLRFAYPGLGLAGSSTPARGKEALGAWVYVNQANQIEGMYMSGREQKP